MSDAEHNAGLEEGRKRMDELRGECTPAEIEEWLHLMIEHRMANLELGTDTPYDAGFIEGAVQRLKELSDPH
jgi:hypothetical protein